MELNEIVHLYAQALDIPPQQVSIDTGLFAQGATSLRAAWLFSKLRQRFGVNIPAEDFWTGLTPRDILKYMTS